MSTYIGELFSVFFRWWWAAIAGTASIAGLVLAPNGGVNIPRPAFALLLFVGLTLLFLVVSTTFVSWKWFVSSAVHATVERIVPEEGDTPLTFVVRAGVAPLAVGQCLALYRITEHDIEACAAVLLITSERKDGKGYQAEPQWMASAHKGPIQSRQVKPADLRLRQTSPEVVQLVDKCAREG